MGLGLVFRGLGFEVRIGVRAQGRVGFDLQIEWEMVRTFGFRGRVVENGWGLGGYVGPGGVQSGIAVVAVTSDPASSSRRGPTHPAWTDTNVSDECSRE